FEHEVVEDGDALVIRGENTGVHGTVPRPRTDRPDHPLGVPRHVPPRPGRPAQLALPGHRLEPGTPAAARRGARPAGRPDPPRGTGGAQRRALSRLPTEP